MICNIPKSFIIKLKYRYKLQLRTIEGIIECCGIRMGLLTRNDADMINDYLYFCLSKACKSLKAARVLYDHKFYEDCLTLIRSAYESYLSLRYMLESDEEGIIDFLIRNPIGLNLGIYEHPTKNSGNKDKSKIIDKRTEIIREHKTILIKTLSEKTGYDLDDKIHSRFYSYLCDHVHTNMDTSGHYFTDEGGVPEFNCVSQEYEYPRALFLGIYVSNLLLAEAVGFEDLDPPELESSCRQIIGAAELVKDYIDIVDHKKEFELYRLLILRIKETIKTYLKSSYMNPRKREREKIKKLL